MRRTKKYVRDCVAENPLTFGFLSVMFFITWIVILVTENV